MQPSDHVCRSLQSLLQLYAFMSFAMKKLILLHPVRPKKGPNNNLSNIIDIKSDLQMGAMGINALKRWKMTLLSFFRNRASVFRITL